MCKKIGIIFFVLVLISLTSCFQTKTEIMDDTQTQTELEDVDSTDLQEVKTKQSSNTEKMITQEEQSFAVIVAPVNRGIMSEYLLLSGDVRGSASVAAIAETGGEVTRVFVKLGSVVKKNAALMELDPSRPGQKFSRHVVRSPIAGKVAFISFRVGANVRQGVSVATISATSKLEVVTQVAERFVVQIKKGLRANVTFSPYAHKIYQAYISEVSPVIDPIVRTMEVRFLFAQHYPEIKPGMYATIDLITNQKRDVIRVPSNSIVHRAGRSVVYVVNSQENIAQEKEITAGIYNDDITEIVKGLQEGELLVIQGQSFLADNEPINIINTVDIFSEKENP